MSGLPDQYFDLGHYHLKITANSPVAQTWFNGGLIWAYYFNHDEAAACFIRAREEDPSCAMAFWGNLQPIERSLIEAIITRFPAPGTIPQDFGVFDNVYASAMQTVATTYGKDPDVLALFADSLMCKRPRRLWDLEKGYPATADTTEAQMVLEAALNRPGGINYPALTHLYAHLMEGSFFPEKALHAADRLRSPVPHGSHVQHMATHIDLACGDYRLAIDSNRKAMAADDLYFQCQIGSPMYTVYRAHNIPALAYSAMMADCSKDAVIAGRRLSKIITPVLLSVKSPPMDDWAEYLHGTLAHVLVRFGRWEEILRNPLPENPELMPITTAAYPYARGLAFAALGRVPEARYEKAKMEAVLGEIPAERQYGLNCPAHRVLGVALLMLEGEVLY
ncbi:tetratricopeptide-like helical [Colletotrichum incanum]|uniref:Tetratricopeptide-like helical n=1 Tax=Colletotrichum incanum TaxID=1573173 RepID=A0A162PKZ4_COLIC|nr:tetratricopeptide-like helical [Colletotrichum incanum]